MGVGSGNLVWDAAYSGLGDSERSFAFWWEEYHRAQGSGKDGVAREALARAYVMPDGFLAFCRDVLGYNAENYRVGVVEHFHGPIARMMAGPSRFRMLQACRGSYKSSMAVVGYALWLIARETALRGRCDIRILLGSEVLQLATSNLREIRWHLESNEDFIQLYGDHKPENARGEARKPWGDSQLMSAYRRRSAREATVELMALGRERTGYHGEVIILDDLQAYRGSYSRSQLERCWDLYRLCHSLLEPGGEMSIVSTRWHYDDIYSRILREDEEAREFEVLIRPAEDENGVPTFPERFDREELDRIKARLGPYLYSCQYLLNPLPDENRIFRGEWVQYIDDRSVSKAGMVAVGGVDLAYETGDKHCYSVVMTALVDSSWNVYVVDVRRFRATVGDVIEEMYRQNEMWGVTMWGIGREDRRGLAHSLDREAYSRGVVLNVNWIDIPKSSKSEQARRTLQPMFQAGKIFLPRGAKWLLNELLDFPLGQTDDGIDALERLVRASVPANAAMMRGPHEDEGISDPGKIVLDKLAQSGVIVAGEGWEYE